MLVFAGCFLNSSFCSLQQLGFTKHTTGCRKLSIILRTTILGGEGTSKQLRLDHNRKPVSKCCILVKTANCLNLFGDMGAFLKRTCGSVARISCRDSLLEARRNKPRLGAWMTRGFVSPALGPDFPLWVLASEVWCCSCTVGRSVAAATSLASGFLRSGDQGSFVTFRAKSCWLQVSYQLACILGLACMVFKVF